MKKNNRTSLICIFFFGKGFKKEREKHIDALKSIDTLKQKDELKQIDDIFPHDLIPHEWSDSF